MQKRKIVSVNQQSSKVTKIIKNENNLYSVWLIKELVQYILLLLSIEDLIGLNIVCKSWNNVLSSEGFWKKKVLLQFPSLCLLPSNAPIQWKEWIKKKFPEMNWKHSFAKLKKYSEQNTSCDDMRDFLSEKFVNDRKVYKQYSVHEPVGCEKKDDEIYMDFLIASSIIHNIERKNLNYITDIEMFNTEGKTVFFRFRCCMKVEVNKRIHPQDIPMTSSSVTMEYKWMRYGRAAYHIGPEAHTEEIEGLYDILKFPKKFPFKIFSTQMLLICQKEIFSQIYCEWSMGPSRFANDRDSDQEESDNDHKQLRPLSDLTISPNILNIGSPSSPDSTDLSFRNIV